MKRGKRLAASEVGNETTIKIDRTIRKLNDNVKGLMIFGADNDYPQLMEGLINGSVTAKAAASMYSRFLAGVGFVNKEINDITVGYDPRGKKISMQSILGQVANSVAYFNGYYIHSNIKLDGRIKSTHLKAFKNCRFSMVDGRGYSAKILEHPNWAKDRSLGGFKVADARTYDVFNLVPEVWQEQVKNSGGIKKYSGQVYFSFLDEQFFYPLSPFDPTYLDCDTEGQISLFKNKQIRDGFFDKIIMRVAAGGTDEEAEDFLNDVKKQLGPDGDPVIVLEDDIDPISGEVMQSGSFRVENLKSNANPKLFDSWEKGLANNIRKSVRGIPEVLIDYEAGQLGTTSGEAIVQAVNFYNELTRGDREHISKSFREIYKNFDNTILQNNDNWDIEPLTLA